MDTERHRVLIIGVGSIGERHLRCFQTTGRADIGFVEINDALRRTIAERYAVAHAYPELDAALAFRPVVAVIATPAPLHVPLATRLAERGIHLLIEKPLSICADGVDRLEEVVRARRVTAAVAYVYRCNPLLAAMRQAIHEGRFGKPVELVAVSGQHFPTYRPAYRDVYFAQRATGGGAIQDALTHALNAGEWLLGPIDRLVADAAHLVLDGVDVEDTAHLLARHGGVLATYSLNMHQAPFEFTITVVCERGTARFEYHESRWRWLEQPGAPWHDEAMPPLERDSLFITQANRFLDAVEGRAGVLCSLSEGIQTLHVNLAALASVERGSWETVRAGGCS
jgi:predicted dehydrogenase